MIEQWILQKAEMEQRMNIEQRIVTSESCSEAPFAWILMNIALK